MNETWRNAYLRYAKLLEQEGVGMPGDEYRFAAIAEQRTSRYPEADYLRAAEEITDFLASEDGVMAKVLIVASEKQILLDYFADEERVFIYTWCGDGFHVDWLPRCVLVGSGHTEPCVALGCDAVSVREVLEVLCRENILAPTNVLGKLREAVDALAAEAPDIELMPERRPRLRLVQN